MCQDSCLELEHAEREPFLLRFDAVENDLSEFKILKICCDFDAFAMNKVIAARKKRKKVIAIIGEHRSTARGQRRIRLLLEGIRMFRHRTNSMKHLFGLPLRVPLRIAERVCRPSARHENLLRWGNMRYGTTSTV